MDFLDLLGSDTKQSLEKGLTGTVSKNCKLMDATLMDSKQLVHQTSDARRSDGDVQSVKDSKRSKLLMVFLMDAFQQVVMTEVEFGDRMQ